MTREGYKLLLIIIDVGPIAADHLGCQQPASGLGQLF